MHELHLMRQVVKAAEAALPGTEGARLSVVRLKVSTLSHLLAHGRTSVQTAFVLAAHGTKAEGATLEIIPVPGDAWCPRCNRSARVTGSDEACVACGGQMVAGPAVPEVVLHEVVVEA